MKPPHWEAVNDFFKLGEAHVVSLFELFASEDGEN
jgi:hypothetical protein